MKNEYHQKLIFSCFFGFFLQPGWSQFIIKLKSMIYISRHFFRGITRYHKGGLYKYLESFFQDASFEVSQWGSEGHCDPFPVSPPLADFPPIRQLSADSLTFRRFADFRNFPTILRSEVKIGDVGLFLPILAHL